MPSTERKPANQYILYKRTDTARPHFVVLYSKSPKRVSLVAFSSTVAAPAPHPRPSGLTFGSQTVKLFLLSFSFLDITFTTTSCQPQRKRSGDLGCNTQADCPYERYSFYLNMNQQNARVDGPPVLYTSPLLAALLVLCEYRRQGYQATYLKCSHFEHVCSRNSKS